jgi:predicted alpha/beta superfamily hydrolase
MVTKPQLFSGYIAVSPSLWYDDKVVFKHEQQSAAARKHSPARAFFGVGSEETPKFGTTNDLVADQVNFVAALESRKFPHVKLSSHVFPDENHDTVFPAALTRGIMFVLGK